MLIKAIYEYWLDSSSFESLESAIPSIQKELVEQHGGVRVVSLCVA